MKTVVASILLISIFHFAFIQMNDETEIDKYVASIERALAKNELSVKGLDHMSPLGGSVTGYYSGKGLVLIKTIFRGELGYESLDFYILKDILVFVKEKHKGWVFPDDEIKSANYVNTHTRKDGSIDLSDLPMSANEYNTYYFSDNKIVKATLKSFNKVQRAYEDKLAEKNKEIIKHYKAHVEELK